MRIRVDELAARCQVSVDTVRFYQSRGLLPRPVRDGRHAWYGREHLERLERIRELKARGLSLAVIGRVLAGELDPGEQALALALAGPLPGEGAPGDVESGDVEPGEVEPGEVELFDTDELARRTGVSLALLEAVQREGLLVPRTADGEPRYSAADVGVVRSGLALLEAGVPLSELLALARQHDAAMRATAERAVDLFARYVRDPLRGQAAADAGGDEQAAAEQMVAVLHALLPATSTVVAHHFRRRLLAAARERIEGGGAEPAVLEAGLHADLEAG